MQSKFSFKTVALGAVAALSLGVAAERASAAEAIFAGGCFWCVEADFEKIDGVSEVTSGFTGGEVSNPSYKAVSKGNTGHVEAARIEYDPAEVSYDELLFKFFRSVDPTDAGGQFCDRGHNYTTAIFVNTPQERSAAEKAKAQAEKDLGQAIVTPILDAQTFYPAEVGHQDYYKKNDLVFTRRGPKTKADAYVFYRTACGRDARVKELWGSEAAFAS